MQQRIKKYLIESIHFINKINEAKDLTIKVGKTKAHTFNNRQLKFSKILGSYSFSTTTIIQKGIQRERELEVNRETEIEFINESLKLYTKGKYFHVNHVDYDDFNPIISNEKKISGTITSISNQKKGFYKKERKYRAILPLKHKVSLRGDFTGWGFLVHEKFSHETLMKLEISKKNFHFYSCTINNQSYFIIDSIDKIKIKQFQTTVNSILLSYAFLKGEYHGKEIYFLTYKNRSFKKPKSILSQILGGGIYNGFLVHSTKPYSIVEFQNKIRYKKDKNGKIIGINDSQIRKYMVEFPEECFSNLCNLIAEKGGILRGVILLVSNNSATLEMKIPILFVALENITKVLIGKDAGVHTIIQDENILNEIKLIVKNSVKLLGEVERKHLPQSRTSEEKKEHLKKFSRVKSKFCDFNKGTNNKKLIEPFKKFGYNLPKDEEDLILIYRNKFLHGDDFMTMDESYELEFQELFHISMKLHKLISILLLKSADYSGYILNNPRIHSYISEKKIKEEIFLKI